MAKTVSRITATDVPALMASARDRLDGRLMRAFPARGETHMSVLAWFDRMTAGEATTLPEKVAALQRSWDHSEIYCICRAARCLRDAVERLGSRRREVAAAQTELGTFRSQWPAPYLTEAVALQGRVERAEMAEVDACRRVRRIIRGMR